MRFHVSHNCTLVQEPQIRSLRLFAQSESLELAYLREDGVPVTACRETNNRIQHATVQ